MSVRLLELAGVKFPFEEVLTSVSYFIESRANSIYQLGRSQNREPSIQVGSTPLDSHIIYQSSRGRSTFGCQVLENAFISYCHPLCGQPHPHYSPYSVLVDETSDSCQYHHCKLPCYYWSLELYHRGWTLVNRLLPPAPRLIDRGFGKRAEENMRVIAPRRLEGAAWTAEQPIDRPAAHGGVGA